MFVLRILFAKFIYQISEFFLKFNFFKCKMKDYNKKYKHLLELLENANGRKETISLLHEAAKIYSRLNNEQL